jgi:hypothetical protein
VHTHVDALLDASFRSGDLLVCIPFLHHASTPQRACFHSFTCRLQLYTFLTFCPNLLFCTFCRQSSPSRHARTQTRLPAIAARLALHPELPRAPSVDIPFHRAQDTLLKEKKKSLPVIDCIVVLRPATCSRLLFPPSPSRLALTFPTPRSSAPARPPTVETFSQDWSAHSRRYNPV